MWDEPEPGEKNNRFARRDVTKATRAAEYWSSQHDEYALPGQPGHSQVQQPYQGFNSARAMARDPNQRMSKPYKGDPANRSPPKPVVKLQSKSQIDYEPMPFTFGTKDAEKKDPDLGSFANNNSSSLSAMKNLGLPGENEPLGSGSAKVNSIGNAGTNAQSGKPAKRLGMGRSAPKGAKK
jgi:DNA helicase-2/ATP-dependent DNA helicase PcrA